MEILGIIGPWQILILLVFSLLFIIPWVIALVDILSNEFTGNNKLIWALVVALTGILGALLYFIIGLRQKLPK
jgi:fatty-acid desaturase